MRPQLPEMPVGATHSLEHLVGDEDTARHYGSGALEDLLATPNLVSLMIEACVDLVDPMLPSDLLSIGKRIEVQHVQPTPRGMNIRVRATLAQAEGNRLHFTLEVTDEIGTVATGEHDRFVVSNSGIREKARQRVQSRENGG